MKRDRKQLELLNIVHRCRHCKRELRNRKSIKRKAGIVCYRREVAKTRTKPSSTTKSSTPDPFLEGLRLMAARENLHG
jgi:hypothetical protein